VLSYLFLVIGFLRFLGILNVGVWLGGAVFFTFGAALAIFSQETQNLLGPKNYSYFSGAIAQIVVARYFRLQMVCCVIALLHVLAEWLYCGKTPRKMRVSLLIGLVTISLFGDFGLQPILKKLREVKYSATATAAQREAASRSFGAWHGISQAVNLLMLAGLTLYLWRLTNPPEEPRFLNAAKIRS
jgi:glycerol-3-phosphate acyltransferase PlsY